VVLAAKQDNPIKRRPRHSLSGIALPRVDGRTVAARRFRELVDAFSAELGANLTETERGMVRQAAALQLRIEQMQGAIVESPDIDADLIIRLSSEHRRLLTKLRGKAAKNKPAVATIADYVARKVAEKAASAPDGDAA
jgi:protein-tyrosine-phosphatase